MSFGAQGGGGDGQAAVAASQATANAKMARLQSAATRVNIRSATQQIIQNLNQFDEVSRQAQGTTALELARSGAMTSRYTSPFASSEELGIMTGVVNPVEAILAERENSAEVIGGYDQRVSAINAVEGELNQYRGELSTLEPDCSGGGGDGGYGDGGGSGDSGDTTGWAGLPEERAPSSMFDEGAPDYVPGQPGTGSGPRARDIEAPLQEPGAEIPDSWRPGGQIDGSGGR